MTKGKTLRRYRSAAPQEPDQLTRTTPDEQAARQAEADLLTYRDDPAILAAIEGKTFADGLVVRTEREEALATCTERATSPRRALP